MRKALLALLFVILTALPASAVTERVVSIRPDCTGYSDCYTSLASALSGELVDLRHYDRQLTIQCYPMLDTTPGVISEKFNADQTHFVKITVPEGYRHKGFYTTNSYRLEASANHLLDNLADYTIIEWMQLKNTRDAPGWYAVANNNNNGNVGAVWRNNIITADVNAAGIPVCMQMHGVNTEIYRNIIYDCKGADNQGFGIYSHASSHEIIQNTLFEVPIDCENQASTLKQNYVGNTANYDYFGCENTTHSRNMSSDYTSPDGATYQGKNSYGDYFEDYPNKDFHLKSTDTVLKDAGDCLGSPYDVDIDGQPVTETWDIGADEHVAECEDTTDIVTCDTAGGLQFLCHIPDYRPHLKN